MTDNRLPQTQPVHLRSQAPQPDNGQTRPVVAARPAPGPAQAYQRPAPGTPGGAPPPPGMNPNRGEPRRWRLPAWIVWAVIAASLTACMVVMGGLAGWQTGEADRYAQATLQGELSLQVQFDLAVQDIAEGRYEVARRRLDWVITQNPNYPNAGETLVSVMQILYATATPTALPPTITPTPTQDPRPMEELFSQAQALLAAQNWTGTIDTLNSLRKSDRNFRTPDVDGMLYLALRYRGVQKILNESNLEGGIYDLALAERFGPLDADATTARNWARIYMIGNSFWEADPERAVYYFQQVAAGMPNLRDGSGWTAAARYRGALIQLGDLYAKQGKWCEAVEPYELALSYGADATLQSALQHAQEMCAGPSATPETPTETPTPSETPTLTGAPTNTVTPTPSITPTPTNTSAAPTSEAPPTVEDPTETPQAPTETLEVPTNTAEAPTNTPEPPATETFTPEPPTNTPELIVVPTETPTPEAAPTQEAPTEASTPETPAAAPEGRPFSPGNTNERLARAEDRRSLDRKSETL